MPYILKNNKIDKRYEGKFFEIIKDNLPKEKIDYFNFLLKQKTDIVADFLNNIGKNEYDKSDFDNLLSCIFTARRHMENIISDFNAVNLTTGILILSEKKKSAEIRIGRFLEAVNYDNVIVKRDIAIELLHFYEPDKNILWTSWIYRPDNGTGCLPYMADFLKRTWEGNPYIMPFSIKEMRDEIDYLYELSNKNGFNIEPPYGVDILLSYMYADYVYKMVYAESKSLSVGVPEGFTLMEKLLGLKKPPVVINRR